MLTKNTGREWLTQDFGQLIETLKLPDLQKHFLKSRWLDQVLWMEGKANNSRVQYYTLRLVTIIGGVIVPILVSLNISSENVGSAARSGAVILGGVVAVSAAVEEFFHYGERWRNYRRSVESLKTQGWLFFELSGPYLPYKSHEEAFSIFANRVEDIIQRDVEVYVTQIVHEKKQKEDEEKQGLLSRVCHLFKMLRW